MTTNEMAGEVWNGQRNSVIPFGEAVADAYGLVFYLKNDGKLYRARADAAATARGPLFLCRAASVTANGYGDVLAMGPASKSTWNWTVGGELYLSPTTLGAMTQTKPDPATQIVRALGHAVGATAISFRPFTAAQENAFALTDIAGSQGSLILKGATEWVATPASALPNHPLAPGLPNRVLRIKDGASTPNDLEIHQVWIPFFRSAGFTQPNLNDLILGGFWVDKFQACMPLATATSRGGLTPNSPGAGVGAACKPHVVPWTDVSWNTARAALENRGGAANKSASGTPTACAMYASGDHPKAEFLVDNIDHLVGRRVEIVQDGTTYFRRIIKAGKFGEAKYVRVFPDLPATLATDDTYTIIGHHMITPDEQFALAAWAMTFRYRHGLSYPKGNNDYGKDIGDTRAIEYEGLTDPVLAGDATHEKRRCLTGSGPLSWSLNGRADGVWDLNGNVWEWNFQQIVSDGVNLSIAPGYPGAGTIVTPPGTSGQRITAMYDADAPVDGLSLNPDICLPTGMSSGGSAEFGNGGCWWKLDAATYAALRGGRWDSAARAGLFSLFVYYAPSDVRFDIGFRGVC